MVFTCDQCGKEFHARANLRDHEMVHNRQRVACTEPGCSATLSSYANLRRHDRDIHAPQRAAEASRAERERQRIARQQEMDRLRRENENLKAKINTYNAHGRYN